MKHDEGMSKLHNQNMSIYLSLLDENDHDSDGEGDNVDIVKKGRIATDNNLNGFRRQAFTELTPFLFWLLCDTDPMGYGEIITPPCNHRQTDQSVFSAGHGRLDRKPDELLLLNAGDSANQYFQSGSIEVLPYEIVSAKESGEEEIIFQSVATSKFENQTDDLTAVKKASMNIKVSYVVHLICFQIRSSNIMELHERMIPDPVCVYHGIASTDDSRSGVCISWNCMNR